MYLNLFAKLAVLLALLTSTGLTDTGCYTTGNTWSDLGDDEEISVAFKILCGHMAGQHYTYDTV